MSASDDSSAACRVSTTQASLDDRPETVQEGPGNNGTDGLQILSSGGAGTRMILTAEDARTIYQVKRKGKSHHDAASLGEHYRITAKAVRDVWRHRTWARPLLPLSALLSTFQSDGGTGLDLNCTPD